MARITSVTECACWDRDWLEDFGRQLTKLSEIRDWSQHVKQLPLMEESSFKAHFSFSYILLETTPSLPPNYNRKKEKTPKSDITTCGSSLVQGPAKAALLRSKRGKSCAHCPRFYILFSCQKRSMLCCRTDKNALIKEVFPQHAHDSTIQKSIKITKNHLSKMIIILSNKFP